MHPSAKWRASRRRCCEASPPLLLAAVPGSLTRSGRLAWASPTSQPRRSSGRARAEAPPLPLRPPTAPDSYARFPCSLCLSPALQSMQRPVIDWFALHEHTAAFNAAAAAAAEEPGALPRHATGAVAGPLQLGCRWCGRGLHRAQQRSVQRQVFNRQPKLFQLRPQAGGIPRHHNRLLRGVQPPLRCRQHVCRRDALNARLVPAGGMCSVRVGWACNRGGPAAAPGCAARIRQPLPGACACS